MHEGPARAGLGFPISSGFQPSMASAAEGSFFMGGGFVFGDAGYMECDDSGTRRGERAQI